MSEVHNTKSENWCLKSTIGSLLYEVWRNLKFDVRKLSELCPKSEVQSMSKIWVWNQSLKSVSCMLSKSVTKGQSLNAQNLKLKVWSWESIWSPFKVFCNYYNFVIQYQYYILCVCRLINYNNSRPIVPISLHIPIIILGIVKFSFQGLLYYNLIRRSYYQNI